MSGAYVASGLTSRTIAHAGCVSQSVEVRLDGGTLVVEQRRDPASVLEVLAPCRAWRLYRRR